MEGKYEIGVAERHALWPESVHGMAQGPYGLDDLLSMLRDPPRQSAMPPLMEPIVPGKQDGPVVGTRVVAGAVDAVGCRLPVHLSDRADLGIVRAIEGYTPDDDPGNRFRRVAPHPRVTVEIIAGPGEGETVEDDEATWRPVDVRRAIQIRQVTDGPWAGWMFTMGLEHLRLPELEVRNVPLWLGPEIAMMLNHVARFMSMTGIELNDGDTLALAGLGDHHRLLRFVALNPLPDEDQFYRTERPRLCIMDDPRMAEKCSNPNCPGHATGGDHVH